MLRMGKMTDYATVVLASLAQEPARHRAATELAERTRLSRPTVSKVLKGLQRAGLVISSRGSQGGYRLARDPEQISALEVIRSIDGPIILTHCFTEHDSPAECDQSELCPVREPLRKVHEGMLKLLSGITIADLSSSDMRVPVLPLSSIQPLSASIRTGNESR